MSKIIIKVIGGSLDNVSDKEINQVRQDLYEFMCYRRKLLGVVEYETEDEIE